jgi:hypothetical protein
MEQIIVNIGQAEKGEVFERARVNDGGEAAGEESYDRVERQAVPSSLPVI